jgi:hypothetical protein
MSTTVQYILEVREPRCSGYWNFVITHRNFKFFFPIYRDWFRRNGVTHVLWLLGSPVTVTAVTLSPSVSAADCCRALRVDNITAIVRCVLCCGLLTVTYRFYVCTLYFNCWYVLLSWYRMLVFHFNPLPALTHCSVLDLNAACQPKRTKTHRLTSS